MSSRSLWNITLETCWQSLQRANIGISLFPVTAFLDNLTTGCWYQRYRKQNLSIHLGNYIIVAVLLSKIPWAKKNPLSIVESSFLMVNTANFAWETWTVAKSQENSKMQNFFLSNSKHAHTFKGIVHLFPKMFHYLLNLSQCGTQKKNFEE